jgi:hypothetical protein
MRELEAEGGLVRPAAEPTHRPHDTDGAWDVARRSVASGAAPTGDHRGMLHLQRLAGNASVGALVQREEDEATGQEDAGRSPVLDVIGKGGGEPLPTALRTTMEQSLGADFSSVRVHDGPTAAASAQAVGASAYTVGDEIVFNRGAYDPESPRGQHTLAHELTHVVQQRSGPVEGTPTGDGVAVSDPGDRFEREAEATASAFTAGGAAPAAPGTASSVQRHADGDHDETTAQTMPLQRMEEDEEAEDVQLTPLQRQEEGEEVEEEIVPG